MKRLRRMILLLAAATALCACTTGPKVPDWSIEMVGHAERATEAWLNGDARVARRELELARAQAARTGRPQLVARVELGHCAARVASLDFDPCQPFDALQPDIDAVEQAYAHYLYGDVTAAERALLPAWHQAIAAGGDAMVAIDDPLGRLVAAGVLLRRGRASPQVVALAAETASQQGWRRPLLAWLGVQARLADARGDAAEAARLRRRMNLVQPLRD